MTKKKFIYLLIIIGLIIFFNSLFNGFVWDDEEQIVNNSLIHTIANFPAFFTGSTFNTGGTGNLAGIYYKPLMTVFFSFIYSIFGPNPFFFHLLQVFIHIINSILVFLLFRNFFKNLLSFMSALFFLIHPINVEAVVYISALQETLFLLFGLAAFQFLNKIRAGWSLILLLTVTFLLSFLSKETGFLFIPITLLFCWLFQKSKFKYVFFSASISVICYSFMRFILASVGLVKNGPSPIMQTSFYERLLSLPQIFFYYFKTSVFPQNLAIAQHWIIKDADLSNFLLPLFLDILILMVIFLLGLLIYRTKNDIFKNYIFFASWLLLGLSIHLQIFPLDMTVADRWFYFPIIGLIGLISLGWNQIKISEKYSLIVNFCLILLIITFFLRTVIRNTNFKDGLTLYSHDIKISEGAFDLENNLGVELYRAGRFDEATTHFDNSTKLAPNWWTNWNNLGVIMERKNQIEVAKKYYQKAIDNGQYYLAYENLANIYLHKDTPEKAKSFVEQSLITLPNNSQLWFVLAISEYKLGDKDKALSAAKNAYLLNNNQQNSYLYSQLVQDLPLDFK